MSVSSFWSRSKTPSLLGVTLGQEMSDFVSSTTSIIYSLSRSFIDVFFLVFSSTVLTITTQYKLGFFGSSFGRLEPNEIVKVTKSGQFIGSLLPTKELPLHKAFYETRGMKSGAVVHLHSTYSVALSMLPGINEDNVLPSYTPYSVMLLGKVKLLPFFVPGDPAMGDAIKGLAGKRSAVLLANHGPVVSGKDLESAVNAVEELEATAKLALLLRGSDAIELKTSQIDKIVSKFNIEWD